MNVQPLQALNLDVEISTKRKFPRFVNLRPCSIPFVAHIPSHWRVEKLKHVASVRFSRVNKKSEEGEIPVRLCNYTDVYNRDVIRDDPDFMQATATEAEIKRFTLRKGDVLITKDSEEWNDIAVPAYVTEDLPGVLCGYHLALIRPNQDKIYGSFLSRAFSAEGIREQFHIAANGITRFGLPNRAISGFDVGAANPTVNRNHVHPTVVRWPDVQTQNRIVSRRKKSCPCLITGPWRSGSWSKEDNSQSVLESSFVHDVNPYLETLAGRAHPAGGWGYVPGQEAHLEPTC